MVSAVSAICGKGPDVVLGKPNRGFVDIIRKCLPELDPWDILMVGDRLDTDIALARQVMLLLSSNYVEWTKVLVCFNGNHTGDRYCEV